MSGDLSPHPLYFMVSCSGRGTASV